MTLSSVADFVQLVFGGDVPQRPLALGQVAARAAVVYVVGVALVRIGKSRLISRSTPLDVILAFILGSLLSRGITGSAAISETALASAVLVAMHWLLTWLAVRSHWLGRLIKGNFYALVENGQVNWRNMHRAHISQHDLMEELRLNAHLETVEEVKVAYKERSGSIGIVKRKQAHVLEVNVQDGVQVVRIELST